MIIIGLAHDYHFYGCDGGGGSVDSSSAGDGDGSISEVTYNMNSNRLLDPKLT